MPIQQIAFSAVNTMLQWFTLFTVDYKYSQDLQDCGNFKKKVVNV